MCEASKALEEHRPCLDTLITKLCISNGKITNDRAKRSCVFAISIAASDLLLTVDKYHFLTVNIA
jgi:hypothetical protein